MTEVRPGQVRNYRDEYVSGNRMEPVRVIRVENGRVYYKYDSTERIHDVSLRRFEYWWPTLATEPRQTR